MTIPNFWTIMTSRSQSPQQNNLHSQAVSNLNARTILSISSRLSLYFFPQSYTYLISYVLPLQSYNLCDFCECLRHYRSDFAKAHFELLTSGNHYQTFARFKPHMELMLRTPLNIISLDR